MTEDEINDVVLQLGNRVLALLVGQTPGMAVGVLGAAAMAVFNQSIPDDAARAAAVREFCDTLKETTFTVERVYNA